MASPSQSHRAVRLVEKSTGMFGEIRGLPGRAIQSNTRQSGCLSLWRSSSAARFRHVGGATWGVGRSDGESGNESRKSTMTMLGGHDPVGWRPFPTVGGFSGPTCVGMTCKKRTSVGEGPVSRTLCFSHVLDCQPPNRMAIRSSKLVDKRLGGWDGVGTPKQATLNSLGVWPEPEQQVLDCPAPNHPWME